MPGRRWFGLIALTVLSLAAAGCEDLGLDPSGNLACSPPPRSQCPDGFFCSGGICWRKGTTPDGAAGSVNDARADAGSADAVHNDARVDIGDVDAPHDTADARDEGTGDGSVGDVPVGDVSSPDASPADAKDASPEAPAADVAPICQPGACSPPCHKADVSSCGPTCKVCPAPAANGHASCDGNACGIACDSGYRNCPGTQVCIRTGTPNCCADSECPTNAPACVSGICKSRSLNDPCSTDTECGSGHCAPTSSGASTKVCCNTACTGSCNDGCAGGMCQHKAFRTECGEIDQSPHSPRYFVCDGNGNCDPPSFKCNGSGNVCAASSDVVCCADPSNGSTLGCVTPTTCASQGVGDFEMSCAASIDCPAGEFCCSQQNQLDLLITGCAPNCQTYSTEGRDPTQYLHNQMCDLLRDPSCPVGKTCQVDQITGLEMCSP